MALSKDDLRIGNLVYKLEINNNIFRRKKLSMVDSDGNEWHRYDQELWTYSATPMKICGVIKQVVRGLVISDNISEDEYHLQPVNSTEDDIDFFVQSQLLDDNPRAWTQFFPYMDEAIAAGEHICVNSDTHNEIIPHPKPGVHT